MNTASKPTSSAIVNSDTWTQHKEMMKRLSAVPAIFSPQCLHLDILHVRRLSQGRLHLGNRGRMVAHVDHERTLRRRNHYRARSLATYAAKIPYSVPEPDPLKTANPDTVRLLREYLRPRYGTDLPHLPLRSRLSPIARDIQRTGRHATSIRIFGITSDKQNLRNKIYILDFLLVFTHGIINGSDWPLRKILLIPTAIPHVSPLNLFIHVH